MQAPYSLHDPQPAEQGQPEVKKKRKWDVVADSNMAGPATVQSLPGASSLPLQAANTSAVISQPPTASTAAAAGAAAALSKEAVEKAREAAKAIAAQLSQANPKLQTPSFNPAAAAAVAAALAAVNNPTASLLEREVIINDAVPATRSHLLKKSTQNELEKRHSVQISVAGRFYTPGQVHDPKEKPLHLFIKPSNVPGQTEQQKAANVLAAANAIIAMMGASVATSGFPSASPSNPAPATITSIPSHLSQQTPMPNTQQGLQPQPPYVTQQPNAYAYNAAAPHSGYGPGTPQSLAYNPNPQQQHPGQTMAPNVYNPNPQQQQPPMGHPQHVSAPWAATAQPPQAKFVAWVYVNVSNWLPTYNLPEKIRGPGGSFLAHVQNFSGGAQVMLRGRGSALMEGPDPLHIYIAADTKQQEQQATALVMDLLKTVKDELIRNHPEVTPFVTPSTVVPIPPTAAVPPAGFQPQVTALPHGQAGQPAGQAPISIQAAHTPIAQPYSQASTQPVPSQPPSVAAGGAAAGLPTTAPVQPNAQSAAVQAAQAAAKAIAAANEQKQGGHQTQRAILPAHGYHVPAGPEFPPSMNPQQGTAGHDISTHTAHNAAQTQPQVPHQQHANMPPAATGQHPAQHPAPVSAQPYAAGQQQSIMAATPTQPGYNHAPYPQHNPMYSQQGPASQTPYMHQQSLQPHLQPQMQHPGYSQPPTAPQPPQSHSHAPYALPMSGHTQTQPAGTHGYGNMPPPAAHSQHRQVTHPAVPGTSHMPGFAPPHASNSTGFPPMQNSTQPYPGHGTAPAAHVTNEQRQQPGSSELPDVAKAKAAAQSAVMSVYGQQAKHEGSTASQKPRQPSPPKRRRFQEFVEKPGEEKQSKVLPSYLSSYVNVTAGSAAQTEEPAQTNKNSSSPPDKSKKSDAEKMPPPPPRFVKPSQQQQGSDTVQQQSTTALPGLADYGDADD